MSIEFMSMSFMPVDWAEAKFAVVVATTVRRYNVVSVFISILQIQGKDQCIPLKAESPHCLIGYPSLSDGSALRSARATQMATRARARTDAMSGEVMDTVRLVPMRNFMDDLQRCRDSAAPNKGSDRKTYLEIRGAVRRSVLREEDQLRWRGQRSGCLALSERNDRVER